MLEKLPSLSLPKTRRNYSLPHEYVVQKFYELGFFPIHNKYGNTYQCSCPVCREGKSFGKKKRCFYIPEKELIYCHNCGQGWKPFDWISTVGELDYNEIWDQVEEGEYDVLTEVDLDKLEKKVIKVESLPEDSINLFDPVQLAYWMDNDKVKTALEYISKRRLSLARNRPDAVYLSLKDKIHKNRLVFPFKDEQGKILFYQSRKLFEWDDKPKYTSKLDADKTVCGLDKINPDIDSVFIFEGPIDSFFVKNGTAVGGISRGVHSLTPTQKEQYDSLKFFQKIWCLDSQWLDETSREKTEMLINQGEKVFIWPEKYGAIFKDLNELCVAHKLNEISPKFIKNNSYIGANAKYKLDVIKVKLGNIKYTNK